MKVTEEKCVLNVGRGEGIEDGWFGGVMEVWKESVAEERGMPSRRDWLMGKNDNMFIFFLYKKYDEI